jgi:hypothetical protein
VLTWRTHPFDSFDIGEKSRVDLRITFKFSRLPDRANQMAFHLSERFVFAIIQKANSSSVYLSTNWAPIQLWKSYRIPFQLIPWAARIHLGVSVVVMPYIIEFSTIWLISLARFWREHLSSDLIERIPLIWIENHRFSEQWVVPFICRFGSARSRDRAMLRVSRSRVKWI